MSEDQIILIEKDNGAWIPRNYLPSLDKGQTGGIFGGSLKLTNSNIFFTGRDSYQDVVIPLGTIFSFNETELGIGRAVGGKVGGIIITHSGGTTTFKVGDQKKWIAEIEEVWDPTKIALEKKAKQFEFAAKKIIDYEECIKIWETIGKPEEATRIRELIKNIIDKANQHEKLMEYDEAAEIYKELELEDDVVRVRKLKAEQGAVKVTQKVVHGDEISNTEIKDSVLNRSNIGTGGKSKSEELREAKALLDDGLIDDEEFKQMKKEILGK